MTKRLSALGAGILALLATGCNKNEPQLLDPNTKLIINVKNNVPRAGELPYNPEHYSPSELVEKSFALIYDLPEPDWTGTTGRALQISLPPEYKDIPNAKFKLWGQSIIYKFDDGTTKLVDTFFKARNGRFVEDTNGKVTGFKIIGYLPKDVMEKAWTNINIAYEKGDFETVYKLFNTAITAYPCTEEEWHELNAQGKI